MKFHVHFDASGTIYLMGRICTWDGTGAESPDPSEGKLNLPADYDHITVEVWDVDPSLSAPVKRYGPITLDLTQTIQATLQTGGIWQEPNMGDDLGGNFFLEIPPGAFPQPGHVHRAIITSTTNGGRTSHAVWEGPADLNIPPP